MESTSSQVKVLCADEQIHLKEKECWEYMEESFFIKRKCIEYPFYIMERAQLSVYFSSV